MQLGQESPQPGISDCDGNIASQAEKPCPTHRRAVKRLLKLPLIHLSQPVKCWVYEFCTGREVRVCTDRSSPRRIPRAHILADVAAEDLTAHAFHQLGAARSLVLDCQVRDATRRVHLIWLEKGARRAGVEAPPAASAAVRKEKLRHISFVDRQRGQQDREKSK